MSIKSNGFLYYQISIIGYSLESNSVLSRTEYLLSAGKPSKCSQKRFLSLVTHSKTNKGLRVGFRSQLVIIRYGFFYSVLADIFLIYIEQKIEQDEYSDNIRLFWRYVENTFIFFNGKKNDAQQLAQLINKLHLKIKFIWWLSFVYKHPLNLFHLCVWKCP